VPRQNIRQITDSRVLGAMAHPLRRRLIDVLQVHGPATASLLAGRTKQRVANVSHHLRVLHESGLIKEVPELARDRRERWWRLVFDGLRWTTTDFETDPATALIAQTAESLNLEHHVALVRSWFAVSGRRRTKWEHAAFSTSKWLSLTPTELAEFADQLHEVIERWSTRTVPDDAQPRDSTFFFAYGLPGQP
jgi:DNA-binding transcriptional ArsR family regulator